MIGNVTVSDLDMLNTNTCVGVRVYLSYTCSPSHAIMFSGYVRIFLSIKCVTWPGAVARRWSRRRPTEFFCAFSSWMWGRTAD